MLSPILSLSKDFFQILIVGVFKHINIGRYYTVAIYILFFKTKTFYCNLFRGKCFGKISHTLPTYLKFKRLVSQYYEMFI